MTTKLSIVEITLVNFLLKKKKLLQIGIIYSGKQVEEKLAKCKMR